MRKICYNFWCVKFNCAEENVKYITYMKKFKVFSRSKINLFPKFTTYLTDFSESITVGKKKGF